MSTRDPAVQALIDAAGGEAAFDRRVAVVLGTCALAYHDNDPAKSRSHTDRALGRRQGRRDVALEVLRVLLGADTVEVTEAFIQAMPPDGLNPS